MQVATVNKANNPSEMCLIKKKQQFIFGAIKQQIILHMPANGELHFVAIKKKKLKLILILFLGWWLNVKLIMNDNEEDAQMLMETERSRITWSLRMI